jgi:uncharacterized membrane protein
VDLRDGVISTERQRRLLLAAVILTVVAGIVLRLVSTGELWLDESLSVQIARKPLPQLFAALRQDGSPPLYYLLLHGWIALFGTGTYAVRALSSVISILTLPLAWRAGHRLGGRRLAVPMLLLTASAPYAVRYSTETRMYALVLALVLGGIPVLLDALSAPSRRRLLGVTLLTAALAYTHYWTLFLLGPVALWLAWHRAWRVLGSMAASIILFAPWLPSFFFQVLHTGTPWAESPNLRIIPATLLQWGGPGQLGQLFALILVPLAVVGLTALPPRPGARQLSIDPTGRPGMRALGALTLAPLVVAILLGLVTNGGYALRYTAVCLPFYLLLVARGTTVLPARLPQRVLAVLVIAGLIGDVQLAFQRRTQADTISAAIQASAAPGDVVAYCPDQLAPAVHRLLSPRLGVKELTYADPAGPALVDWVDYAQRVRDLPPAAFARQVLDAAGRGHQVWLVSQDGYRVWDETCSQVAAVLTATRGVPTIEVASAGSVYEHASLARYPGSGG